MAGACERTVPLPFPTEVHPLVLPAVSLRSALVIRAFALISPAVGLVAGALRALIEYGSIRQEPARCRRPNLVTAKPRACYAPRPAQDLALTNARPSAWCSVRPRRRQIREQRLR